MLAISFSASSTEKPGRSMNHNCIHVLSMSNDVFYFKSDKDVAGAVIEVYNYKTGEKVISTIVENKKTLIDLHPQKPGDYIILITKGEFKRKYVFHR